MGRYQDADTMSEFVDILFGPREAQGPRKEAPVPQAGSFAEVLFGKKEEKPKAYAPLKGAVGTAMNFFIGKGYSKHQAAGIVGNLAVESGNFDPDVIAGKRLGDRGKAFGVAQWHPDRQAKFKEAFGKDIRRSSFGEQLEFIHWELNNNEKKAGQKLKGARTAQEAAELFDIHYERSSGEHRHRRIQEATKLFGM